MGSDGQPRRRCPDQLKHKGREILHIGKRLEYFGLTILNIKIIETRQSGQNGASKSHYLPNETRNYYRQPRERWRGGEVVRFDAIALRTSYLVTARMKVLMLLAAVALISINGST